MAGRDNSYGSVRFTIRIDLQLGPEGLTKPYFRYRFNGSKVTTTPVGEAGWDAGTQDGSYSYSKSWEGVEVTDSFLHQLNERPLLSFWLADRAEGSLATVVNPYDAGGTLAKRVGRTYLALFFLDTASLLGGDLEAVLQAKEGEGGEPIEAAFGSTKGLRSIKFSLCSSEPIMGPEALTHWNPLTVEVLKVERLPGIIEKNSGAASPASFSLQQKHCLPVFCVLHSPGNKFSSRAAVSTFHSFGKNLKLNYRTVFLTMKLSDEDLIDAFQSFPLDVEVHDRDCKLSEKEQREIVTRWEQMIVGYTSGDTGSSNDLQSSGSDRHIGTPKDVFTVDEEAVKEIRDRLEKGGNNFSHAVASFRLTELVQKEYGAGPHKYVEEAAPRKKRVVPRDSEEDFGLTQEQRLVRQTGSYLDAGTSVSIRVSIHRSPQLPAAGQQGGTKRFNRLFLMFRYRDVPLLSALSALLEEVNKAALGSGVSLRSYKLSEEERKRAEEGRLDIVTGFQIIDADYRMFFLEGVAGKSIRKLQERLRPQHINNADSRCLSDLSITFSERLYSFFDVDVKRIKLREPLPELITRPDIYNRAVVSHQCFEALSKLATARKLDRLVEAKLADIFPSVSMLLEVESKYGESISLEDIDGSQRERRGRGKQHESPVSPIKSDVAPSFQGGAEESEGRENQSGQSQDAKRRARNAMETDCWNPAFEAAVRSREPKDYLAEIRQLQELDREAAERRKEAQRREAESYDGPVYIYSGQKLQYSEMKKAEMREKLSKDKKATYTYSQELQSLTVELIDPERVAREEEQASKERWMTDRGFVYPAPRPTEEYVKHPKQVSQSRREELQQPWEENAYHPKPVERDANGPEKKFDTIPSKEALFGYVDASGRQHPEFFKSVHLTGEGLEIERAATRKKEEDEWRAKLVVDDESFYPHGNTQNAALHRPTQLDRRKDILDGAAKKKALRIVRNASLPSGKRVPMEPVPASITSTGLYESPASFTSGLRKDEPALLLGVDSSTGRAQDFVRYIRRDEFVPRSQTLRSKHSILPLKPEERVGAKWLSKYIDDPGKT